MRVFVTGGTGFTGSRTIPLLLNNGYQVRCLYRPTSDRTHLPQPEIEWVAGDLSEPQLASSMKDSDVLINIASLGFGHAEEVIRAVKIAGIRRAIFISTTAIFTRLDARSRQIRLAAEDAIQTSGLQYTILRPTMIYGSPRDRNMGRLIRWMRLFPIIPILGNGSYLQQPIYVDDVAQAIVSCFSSDQTIGKCYNIAGKYPLSYNDVINTVAGQLEKRVWKIHIPYKPAVSLLGLFEKLRIPFPIKAEQILRLNEDKAFNYEEAQRDFRFDPLSFEEGIKWEMQSVR